MPDRLFETLAILAVIVAKHIQSLCGWACPILVDR